MNVLQSALTALHLPLAAEDKLNTFMGLFLRWNSRINLSAARSEPELLEHMVDSLHVVPHLRAAFSSVSPAPSASPSPSPDSPAATSAAPGRAREVGLESVAETQGNVLDVGAGGGLPAVVAAICLPDSQFTALEPVHKKHAFLRTAARELALANLEALAERLDDHRGTDYDAAMSRATFDLREWLIHGLTRVRPGGIVLGFEAIPRTDLPASTQRHPYALAGKSRSIVILPRPLT